MKPNPTPDQEPFGVILAQTYRRVVLLLTNRFRPYGITPEQWSLLNQLCVKEGVPQKKLAERTDRDQPTVTRILDVLERKGWTVRKPNSEDRRSFLVYATEEGRKLAAELEPLERQTLQELLECVQESQCEALKQALKRIGERAAALKETSEPTEAAYNNGSDQ
ncbi:MarR family transcriptional regulator [Paenibacillus filicis]|uniref:MarR family transcriptional regulator n=1 Tax=Paenibacillus gyeongsangnamensis TaxID=3388067 RepID=A0ABT4Q6Q4_9BACL|nr:MarR family transcriptional regulator [Paenibacillus filicis]MCZ8512504.1 MarR family transcriptional regulator [Paenibacillus filicis]